MHQAPEQSHEILLLNQGMKYSKTQDWMHQAPEQSLLNKGMKYWDSAFNAQGSRTFIATVYIAAAAVSGPK
jgi:hypothetical protein